MKTKLVKKGAGKSVHTLLIICLSLLVVAALGQITVVFASVSNGVSVSANVPQSLTFTVAGGTAPSGGTVNATALNYGDLSPNTPKTGTQTLSVSTNASGGYNVTASEDTPLTSGTNTIADVTGDSADITESNAGAWINNTTNGFGYTLAGDDVAFNSGYKQFANIAGSETAQTVMSNTGPTATANATVTYKVNVGADQAAGSYANNISYVATGNF